MKTVVSTKTLTTTLRKSLEGSHLRTIDYDFISVTPIDFKYNEQKAISIFTSTNAVKSVLLNKEIDRIRTNKCICVGSKTRQFLKNNGFKVFRYKEYAEELIEVIKPMVTDTNFVFYSGNLRRNTIPDFFKAQHHSSFLEIEVYKTRLTPKSIKEDYDAVLFFSPSAVESFYRLNTIKNQPAICIGTTTAKAALEHSKNVIVATTPSQQAVIQAVENYF